jgi:hypothetical protein
MVKIAQRLLVWYLIFAFGCVIPTVIVFVLF